MAQQRKRKSGQRGRSSPPPARRPANATAPVSFEQRYRERTEARNAAVRAGLEPLKPGEHPWPTVVGAVLAIVSGVVNLALYLAGVRVHGAHTAGPEIIVFAGLMIACGIGLWRLWYQAVLAFMVLLAIIVVIFSLLLVEASNLLGAIVAPVIIIVAGTLFWKLVRVLSRLQMPERPTRR